jgi:Fe2+ or Zn2+ uptake regulation protein
MKTRSLFIQNKIKPTPNRLAVFNILKKAKEPLSIVRIIELLKAEAPSINRATVFRIINLFAEKRLVKRLDFSEGNFRYELSSFPHHHHLVCAGCGAVDDIPLNDNYLIKQVRERTNFKVKSHSLEFFGICTDCQQEGIN